MKGNTNQAAAAGCVGAQPPPPPVTSTATTVATMSENMKITILVVEKVNRW